jgi:hypothetical protein
MTRELIKFFLVSMVALSVTWFFSEIILRIINFWFGSYPSTQFHLEALVGDVSKMVHDVIGLPLSLAFIDRLLFFKSGRNLLWIFCKFLWPQIFYF